MTVRRPILAPRAPGAVLAVLGVFLLGAAACSNGSTSLDNVASVRVTPSSPSIDVGLTVQFTAEALDAGGNVIPGISFEWSSSRTDIVTVDQNGLASALAVGTSAITASAGGGTPGSQVLVVEASECVDRVDVALEVGQHQRYDGDTCLFLPSGSVGDRYRIAVTRPTLIEDPADVPNVWLEINPVIAATTAQTAREVGAQPIVGAFAVAPPSYSTRSLGFELSDRIDGARFVDDHRIKERTRRFHLDLRQREIDAGLRVAPLLPTLSARAASPPSPTGPALADPPAREDLFLVIDTSCPVTATRTPMTLVNFNDDVAIYQDDDSYASSPLSVTATTQMLDYYAAYVRDFIETYWGATPDIDGNGRILLATSDALPDSAAAAVFSGDFRTTAQCASSNEGEIMYFSSEVINDLDGSSPSYLALSVMAHEVKHITSLYNSTLRGAFHSIWIEEGTAEISQTMSSRIAWEAVGGPAVGSELNGNDIIDWNRSNGGIGPEAWGVVSQIADVVAQLSTQPNSLVTNPVGAAAFHTFYAGGWHWHRFIGDAFGNASTPLADGPLFAEMTDDQTPAGTGALLAVTGRTFDQLFEDLVVAMSFHDAGPTPARGFTTWDLNTAGAIFANPPEVAPPHRYPWPITTDVPSDPNVEGNPSRPFSRGVYSCPPRLVGGAYRLASESDRCPMGPSGIRLHDFVSGGEGAGAQVQVFGAGRGTLIVTRIN
ncbi:MAG: Ig-like domain-containing protein [Gemmatimonadota bacterium]|nr:Ig-like domain-containing protein [Gemmatimonadota bacterium]